MIEIMYRCGHMQLVAQRRIIILSFALLLVCCVVAKNSYATEAQETGYALNDFELTDLHGDMHRLSSYKGKAVIVNFWAVWCGPCRKEIPAMNRAVDALKDENIVLLAVNVGDELEAINAFSNTYPMKFPVLMDTSAAVSQRWKVNVFPTTFIIDTSGRTVKRIVGGREWDQKNMLDSVRSIVRSL